MKWKTTDNSKVISKQTVWHTPNLIKIHFKILEMNFIISIFTILSIFVIPLTWYIVDASVWIKYSFEDNFETDNNCQ